MAVLALPLSVAVHSNQLDAVEEVCGPALGCAGPDVLGQLLLLGVFGLLAVVLLAALHHVSEARGALGTERSRTATERDAFDRFARTVAGLDPSASSYQLASADGPTTAASVVGGSPSDGRLEAVRRAYRETVMAMPHFEEEYDESLAHHLGAEFGEEVATAVADGDRLTPELKQVLVERAREAARERERLIHRLEREADALESATDELRSIADTAEEAERRPLGDLGYRQLADEWNRLGELESRLSRLLADRQEALGSRWPAGSTDGHRSLRRYLYGDLDSAFPVLADGAVVADRVKAARSRVLRHLTSRA